MGDETIKPVGCKEWRRIKSFEGHSWDVNSVAFSPDGKYIASGSGDYTVKLWDVKSGEEIKSF